MPVFNVRDIVELLDGGEVVTKARIMNVDPDSTIHGQCMLVGHVSVTMLQTLKGSVYIPYVPPHKLELCTLVGMLGYIIAWLCVALAACP